MRSDSRRRDVVDMGALRESLAGALASAGDDSAAQAEAVLRCLAEQKIVPYAAEGTVALLSMAGRTLMLLSEFPEIRMRELAFRLGVTETYARSQVTCLAGDKIVKRTRVGRQVRYEIDYDLLTRHPDVMNYQSFILNLPS